MKNLIDIIRKFSKTRILVVGDFRFDIMAGHAAGARTALLTNGGKASMHQGDPEPDYRVERLEDILEIVLGAP